MKKSAMTLCLFLLAYTAGAQQFCNPCKDPNKPENIYFTCYQDYNPVCACDGKTYRNDCFALNKYSFYPCGFINGICGSFDLDLNPSFLEVGDDVLNIQVYNRSTGYLSINIFNSYGRLQFQGVFPLSRNINADGSTAGPPNPVSSISTLSWDKGLYLVEAIFEGERKIVKIVKGANPY